MNISNECDESIKNNVSTRSSTGFIHMTMREYFASKAMEGMLANSYSEGRSMPMSEATACEIAEMACNTADCLIAQLEK